MKPKLLFVINFIVIILLLGYYGLFLAKKVDLTTADLGRHIENGKIIVNSILHPHPTSPSSTDAKAMADKEGEEGEQRGTDLHRLLTTNYFSYTLPNEPFVNHHWLSGVVFYLIYQITGFVGLSWFYILLGCATLWLFFDVARRKSNLFIASVITIALMPLLASRTEVRPEMITYFFTGVFLWVLLGFRLFNKNILTSPAPLGHPPHAWGGGVMLLPLVMLLWVNLHIGFVFGFLVLGAFWVEELARMLSSRNSDSGKNIRDPEFDSSQNTTNIRITGSRLGGRDDTLKSFTITGILCVLAALINPNFLKGFLYPLNIFKNYGYLIVENQSIKFLENINFSNGQHFLIFKAVFLLVCISFLAVAVKNWKQLKISFLVLSLFTGMLAYYGIRHFPSFAFFALVALAYNVNILLGSKLSLNKGGNAGRVFSAVIIPVGIFFVFINIFSSYGELKARADFGLGLLPGVNASAEFFKEQNLKGPIFNDYDIGSYLIYNLSEEGSGHSPVFVDNRPEAYTVGFFESYKLMQTDPLKWKEMDEKYNFNSIFFSHRDYTPWAQAFLISRIQDPVWAPVFVDGFNIIFLKRNEQNKEIIEKYEIPKSRFGITTSK